MHGEAPRPGGDQTCSEAPGCEGAVVPIHAPDEVDQADAKKPEKKAWRYAHAQTAKEREQRRDGSDEHNVPVACGPVNVDGHTAMARRTSAAGIVKPIWNAQRRFWY